MDVREILEEASEVFERVGHDEAVVILFKNGSPHYTLYAAATDDDAAALEERAMRHLMEHWLYKKDVADLLAG